MVTIAKHLPLGSFHNVSYYIFKRKINLCNEMLPISWKSYLEYSIASFLPQSRIPQPQHY